MKWYRFPNSTSRRKQRKAKAEVSHECSICQGMHRYVRSYHGHLTEEVRRNNTAEKNLAGGSRVYLDYCIQELMKFERDIHKHNARWKSLDEEMRLGTRYGFSKRVDRHIQE